MAHQMMQGIALMSNVKVKLRSHYIVHNKIDDAITTLVVMLVTMDVSNSKAQLRTYLCLIVIIEIM